MFLHRMTNYKADARGKKKKRYNTMPLLLSTIVQLSGQCAPFETPTEPSKIQEKKKNKKTAIEMPSQMLGHKFPLSCSGSCPDDADCKFVCMHQNYPVACATAAVLSASTATRTPHFTTSVSVSPPATSEFLTYFFRKSCNPRRRTGLSFTAKKISIIDLSVLWPFLYLGWLLRRRLMKNTSKNIFVCDCKYAKLRIYRQP